MGLLCEFDIVDDFGYTYATPEFEIYPDYSEGMDAFVETFLEVATDLVPVDTGFLRRSIDADSDDTYCYAEASCDYAQYPEYGTWCQEAQPYFQPALEAAIDAAFPLWNEAEEEAWDEEQLLIEEAIAEAEAEAASRSAGGGVDFSSVGGFFGSIIGLFVVALVSVAIQGFFDLIAPGTSGGGGGGRGGYGGGGGGGDVLVYVPEVIIT